MNKEDKNKWGIVLSISALAISLCSLVISVRQCSLEENKMKLHLEPNLVCILDKHPEKKSLLLFTIKNVGMANSVNVSVDHFTMRYIKKENRISNLYSGAVKASDYNMPGKRWMFVPKLMINEITSNTTGDWTLQDSSIAIDVLVFDLSYFREIDGKRYDKKVIFYVDGENILTQEQFKKHNNYRDVMTEISNVFKIGVFENMPSPFGKRQ
jgi:hypothetical protein